MVLDLAVTSNSYDVWVVLRICREPSGEMLACMTTTLAPALSSQTHRRRIPKWDKIITGICLVLTFILTINVTMFIGMLAMGSDPCEPHSPCTDQVGRGMQIAALGTVAVLVIGLGCMIVAAITRTWVFIWALATLLLLPAPLAVGSNIVNHASELSTVGPSRS